MHRSPGRDGRVATTRSAALSTTATRIAPLGTLIAPLALALALASPAAAAPAPGPGAAGGRVGGSRPVAWPPRAQ
ncbi:hypothetical protein ACFVIM_33110, partial [Streptomyces sp. NPDC057638]